MPTPALLHLPSKAQRREPPGICLPSSLLVPWLSSSFLIPGSDIQPRAWLHSERRPAGAKCRYCRPFIDDFFRNDKKASWLKRLERKLWVWPLPASWLLEPIQAEKRLLMWGCNSIVIGSDLVATLVRDKLGSTSHHNACSDQTYSFLSNRLCQETSNIPYKIHSPTLTWRSALLASLPNVGNVALRHSQYAWC